MNKLRTLSRLLVGLSLIGIILAAVGAFSRDIWLAATQWLLISAVLVGLSVYVRMEE